MRAFITIAFVVLSLSALGQDLRKIEKDLLRHLQKINYWADYRGDNNKIDPYDSLERENYIFKQKLLSYTSKYPSTLTYDFIELKNEHLTIVASADGKFRIYSWDTRIGGTMHFYENIYQYKINDKVQARGWSKNNKEGDPGRWYSDIFTLDTNKGKIYIGYFHSIFSSSDAYQGVKLFCVQKNYLNDTFHLIRTNTGIKNELGFSFNFFSVVNRKERPVKLIYYEEPAKILKIPIVWENGKVTNKFIVYRFTGQYFERQKDM